PLRRDLLAAVAAAGADVLLEGVEVADAGDRGDGEAHGVPETAAPTRPGAPQAGSATRETSERVTAGAGGAGVEAELDLRHPAGRFLPDVDLQRPGLVARLEGEEHQPLPHRVPDA